LEFLTVASDIRVAGGRKNALDQKSLGEEGVVQIALSVYLKSNKNATCRDANAPD
jgi:hypothetical protein